MVLSFSNTIKFMAGPCSPKHGPVSFTVLKIFFLSGCYAAIYKPFKFVAGPRSPTSPVTAQLILRRWKMFSSWCYADCQQRLNERLVVLPQTRPSSFHGVEEPFRLDDMHTFKTIQVYGWAASQHPLSRPSSFRGVEKSFRFDVMQIFKNFQINGWSCSPKHDPVHFTELSIFSSGCY